MRAVRALRPLSIPRSLSTHSRQAIKGPYDPYNSLTQLLPASISSVNGPLSSFTVAIKENICVKGGKTTCSSRMLQDYESIFDATCVTLLLESGAQITSKTNCDEFGMGSENLHSLHGPVLNPAKSDSPARVAGGSSGGAAAAVRAGLCRIAIGSDTGGSVRLPAAYCGVFGLKPSYGLISRFGLVSYADSLDTIGVLGTTVKDIEKAFNVMSVPDTRDPTCVGASLRRASEPKEVKHMRIGVPEDYFPTELHPRVLPPFRAAVRKLNAMGATIVPISLPSTPLALSAYYVISSAEASSNLARYDGVKYGHSASTYAKARTEAFGPEVKRRILLGTYALTADAFDNFFLAAENVRSKVQDELDGAFIEQSMVRKRERKQGGVDVILHPSAMDTAPKLDDREKDPLKAYVQDVLNVPASLAGLPALSIPMGTAEDGWPVGVTATAQWGHESTLFTLASWLQQS